jgi:hypothetical protein
MASFFGGNGKRLMYLLNFEKDGEFSIWTKEDTHVPTEAELKKNIELMSEKFIGFHQYDMVFLA